MTTLNGDRPGTRLPPGGQSTKAESLEHLARTSPLTGPLLDLPDAVVLTTEGRISLVNRKFEDLSGYRAHEVMAVALTSIVVPHEHSGAEHRGVAADSAVFPPRCTLLRKDGTAVLVDVRMQATEYEGTPANVGVVRVTSDSKADQYALRRSEEKTSALLQAIPDMVFRLDRHGNFLGFTPGIGTEPILPPGEFMGKNIRDIVPTVAEPVSRAIDRTLAGEGIQTLSYELAYGDETRTFEARVTVCGPEEVAAIVRDITELVRAGRSLRDSEARFAAVFRQSPVPVAITTLHEERFVDASDAFLRLSGFEREELVGISADELQLIKIDPKYQASISATANGCPRSRRARLYRKSGRAREVVATAAEITLGDEACVVQTFIDITDRLRLAAALEAAREELEGRVERQLRRANPYKLTFREFSVLNLVADGKADKEIAMDLGISKLTVHRHVRNILGKLNASSRTEAGTRALREGLLE